jgi:hypothetical protein
MERYLLCEIENRFSGEGGYCAVRIIASEGEIVKQGEVRPEGEVNTRSLHNTHSCNKTTNGCHICAENCYYTQSMRANFVRLMYCLD